MIEEKSQKLNIIARSPFKVLYEGPADSISATNKVGNFDILPGHADFFSILSPGSVMIDASSKQIELEITNGILTVRDNEVLLFANM